MVCTSSFPVCPCSSGNGIAERCHRIIKVIAARKGYEIAEAVYLYNITPRDNSTQATAPAKTLYRCPVRIRGLDHCAEDEAEVEKPYHGIPRIDRLMLDVIVGTVEAWLRE